MALIKCPECEKEVSDKAYSCPFCGFPLSDYLEEQEEIIYEQERQLNIDKRKNEYEREYSYTIQSKKYSFNQNHRICALICSEYQRIIDRLHSYYENILFAEDAKGPSDYNPRQFNMAVRDFLSTLITPFVKATMELCDKILEENCEKRECYEKDIKNAIDYRDIMNTVVLIHEKATSDYDLNLANAHSEYCDEYYEAGQVNAPIEAVYSKTLLGMVGANLSAKMINGAVNKLMSGKIKRKEHAAANKYYSIVYRETLLCNAKVYGVLYDYVEEVANRYKKFLFQYLIESGYLFEVYRFPTESFDYDTYETILEEETTLNEEKVQLFIEAINKNPGYEYIYSTALENIFMNVDTLKDLLGMLRFLELDKAVSTILEYKKSPACKFFDESINLNDIQKEISVKSRIYKSNEFPTVEDKEKYIEEEKENEVVHSFLRLKEWYIKEKFIEMNDKIHKINEPTFDAWKRDYYRTISLSDQLYNIVCNNVFLDEIQDIIRGLYDTPDGIQLYSVDTIKEKRGLEKSKYKEVVCSSSDELPVAKIKGNRNTILITTWAFYIFDSTNNEFVVKFDINSVEDLTIEQKSLFSIRYFAIVIKEYGKITIVYEQAREEDYKCITSFANNLRKHINNRKEQELHRNVLKAFEERELYFIENKRYEHIEFTYNFRINYKNKVGFGGIKEMGYDYDEEVYSRIGKHFYKDAYIYCGDYVMHISKNHEAPLIITDHRIYIDKYIFDIKLICEIIRFKSLSGYNQLFQFRFEDGKVQEIITKIPYEDYSYSATLMWVSESIRFNISGEYATVGDKEIQYCICCGKNNIKKTLLGGKCLVCNNTDVNKIYTHSVQSTQVPKILSEAYVKQWETKFKDELEWLEWTCTIAYGQARKEDDKCITYMTEFMQEDISNSNKQASLGSVINDNLEKNVNDADGGKKESNLSDRIVISQNKCLGCGHILQENVKYCNYCGKPSSLLHQICPNCKRIIKKSNKFCNLCGTKIYEG